MAEILRARVSHTWLIIRATIFPYNLKLSRNTSVTDRQTDRQTDANRNSSTVSQVRKTKTDNGHMNSAIQFVLTT